MQCAKQYKNFNTDVNMIYMDNTSAKRIGHLDSDKHTIQLLKKSQLLQ
jgi:hypothetical protein